MGEVFARLSDAQRAEAGEIWRVVFGDDDPATGAGHQDPWRDLDHVFGCALDGKVVSVVQIMQRTAYIPGGQWTFGAIAGVATLEQFRGRGYSSRLMRMAADQMHEDGVDIGLLLTDINPYYERLGWKTIPRTTYRAKIESPVQATRRGESSTDTHWSEYAPIYDAFNKDRPFAVVRTPEYWDGWATQWMRDTTKIVVRDSSQPIAYAIARKWQGGIGICEMGWLPDRPEAAGMLADELFAFTQDSGCDWFGTPAPREPAFLEALRRPGVSVGERVDTALMAMPIERSAEELTAICQHLSAGTGVFWPTDDF